MILKNAVFIFILLLLFIILNLTSYSLLGYVGIVYFYFYAIIYVSVYLGLKFLIRELVFFWIGKFGKNILFAVISNPPNPKDIVQKLFHHVGLMPHFQSDEDAVNHLQQLPKQIGSNPILLILDDVWPGSETLLEKFKLHMPDSKILVTSRTAFRRFSFTYELKLLKDADAKTLFLHSASLQDRSSCITDENIEKVLWQSVIYMH